MEPAAQRQRNCRSRRLKWTAPAMAAGFAEARRRSTSKSLTDMYAGQCRSTRLPDRLLFTATLGPHCQGQARASTPTRESSSSPCVDICVRGVGRNQSWDARIERCPSTDNVAHLRRLQVARITKCLMYGVFECCKVQGSKSGLGEQ